jgi:hypothetical protein
MTLSALRRLDADPLRRYAEGLPGYGGMSPPQRAFHAAINEASKRASISANGIGKSYMGAAETWWLLLGRHPFKRGAQTPARSGWVLAPVIEDSWANISRVLHELQPPDVLDPSCHYREGLGYTYGSRHMLRVRADVGGGHLVGKGCVAPPLRLESQKIDFLWVDEPPTAEHLSAARARVTRTGGPTYLTLTPINRPVGWLRTRLEGDADEGVEAEAGWWMQRVGLSHESAPHLTPALIQSMIDAYEEFERPQRVNAEWEGYTVGRRFAHFTEALIVDDHQIPSYDLDKGDVLRHSWDHGEGDTNQLGYLSLIKGAHTRSPTIYILGESCPRGAGSTPDDIVSEALREMKAWGFSPFNISAAYGDANSAGLLGSGARFNSFIERAFADALGLQEPPFRIQIPAKRPGSVSAGESAMNAFMKGRRIFVHRSCRRLIHSLRHYTLKQEKDLKNAIDAARYGILDLLLSWKAPTHRPIRRG